MKKQESNSAEPLYYVALVLKGTEDQYLKMLKYIQNQNGSQVIYQCKSLTYLRVIRDDDARLGVMGSEPILAAGQRRGKAR